MHIHGYLYVYIHGIYILHIGVHDVHYTDSPLVRCTLYETTRELHATVRAAR